MRVKRDTSVNNHAEIVDFVNYTYRVLLLCNMLNLQSVLPTYKLLHVLYDIDNRQFSVNPYNWVVIYIIISSSIIIVIIIIC